MFKILSLFAIASIALASSASADTYTCSEDERDAAHKGRLQYSMQIKELRTVTDPKIIGENDGATIVRVTVLSRDPLVDVRYVKVSEFVATAFNSDVMYKINSRKNGFSATLFMDEMDQTSVRIRGVRGSIQMTCE